MKKFVTWGGASVVGAVGAAAAFFLDPKSGAKRRKVVAEKGSIIVRRERAHVSTMVAGASNKAKKSSSKPSAPATDDVVAADVRGVLRSQHGAVADGVGVRVARGRVTLRGEVPEIELIGTVARAVEAVNGVREVNNLLRLEISS